MGTGGSFAAALRAGDAAAVRSFPKTDLHAHAYISARIESLERRLGHALLRPPRRMNGLGEFQEYLRLAVDPHVGNIEGAELAAAVAVDDAIDDGVSVFEMSFDIWPVPHYPDGLDGYLRFLQSLVEQCKDRIRLRPELGISRRYASNPALMDQIAEAVASGAFTSIDLYSTEDACAPEDVQPLYAQARAQGMLLKAHVGEFGSAEDVRRTVEVLDLDEVQHGIAAADSTDVMRWLADKGVRLNICPTSNVMLGVVDDIKDHPIRRLHDHGVAVTVNSDDLTVFRQSVSDEYLNLFRAGVFSAEELDDIRVAALESRAS
ncbi:MAG: adenosine deaminase [Chloroflexi bacterium]|nr:adenosine deaminase [Chloroflexota bacterium]